MRFLVDENFNNDILHGLQNRTPDIDVVRVQDTEVYQADDPQLLEWAAQQDRILLTHDVQTIPGYAYERVVAGLPMPGIIEVSTQIGIGEAVEALCILIGAGTPTDFENQVRFVPLR
jgi:hypothetical protein